MLTQQIETCRNNVQYIVRKYVYIHLILPASLLPLYRFFWEADIPWKHAYAHRGGRGRRVANLDAYHCHHCHMPPQTQEHETGEGADREEVCGHNTMFN